MTQLTDDQKFLCEVRDALSKPDYILDWEESCARLLKMLERDRAHKVALLYRMAENKGPYKNDDLARAAIEARRELYGEEP